ncbi:MAG: hypothetical protein JXB05_26795 [Myxococcaceae bacterium]|nr:hypothetical protein [Myxococcaceae bacterium]
MKPHSRGERSELKWDGIIWSCRAEGVPLWIGGTGSGPDERMLSIAKLVMESLPEIEVKAARFLATFLKDPRSWVLQEVDLAAEAERQECDFLLVLSDGVVYCRCSVGFIGKTPRKLIMEIS